MNTKHAMSRFAVAALSLTLAASAAVLHAQGHDDHNQGHDDHGPAQQHGGQPQGRPDAHFQPNDRGNFQSHYASDANKWRNNPKRPHFNAGQAIPRNYAIRAVPASYYRGYPPPPPGYRFGYYDGYVVSYNPTTRIIADVLDLATGN